MIRNILGKNIETYEDGHDDDIENDDEDPLVNSRHLKSFQRTQVNPKYLNTLYCKIPLKYILQ